MPSVSPFRLYNVRMVKNVPGFRPGMVPMGMIKRQFGTTAKVDEIRCV